MGHGHKHGEPYTVPDYKIYKVEDIPILMKTKKALAAQGLSDPWLRNEVWRYQEKEFGTEKIRIAKTVLRGFKYGFSAFVITAVGTAIYNQLFPEDDENDYD